MSEPIHVNDLDVAIEDYEQRSYRLDMIFPADDPREARMSFGDRTVVLMRTDTAKRPPEGGTHSTSQWVRGRAGMEYRDLLPDRLGGKVVASHIRLTDGGEVSDYVHYHKIQLQVIYCKRGRINVVYEGQGEPFWLETGDLILQPPEIRHRVLACTAGAEVIEITSPAEHETWVEHEMELPNDVVCPERLFGGRRFFRHICRRNDARDPFEERLLGLANSLLGASTEVEMLAAVTIFSRSLCQT